MTLEIFAQGPSLVHAADPRLKVVFAAGFAIVVALSYQFAALVAALAYALLFVGLARLDLSAVARRLTALAGFLVLLWLMLPATYAGDALFTVGPITVCRQGVVLAAQISIKTLAYFIGMLFVQAATRAQRVHNAMRCRGFKGHFYSLNDFTPLGQSKLLAGAMTLIVLSLVWLEWV